MRVCIRADSSYSIGSGHVMRCLTLARLLQATGSDIYFLSRNLNGNLNAYIKAQGFNLLELAAPDIPLKTSADSLDYRQWLAVPMTQELKESRRLLTELGPWDLLILDHYSLGSEWEQEMQPLCEKIMVIDDLHDREHSCDLLLDQNLSQNEVDAYQGLVPLPCTMLLGPHYSLLRDEFKLLRAKMQLRQGVVKKVLVYFGGSDIPGMTMMTLRALSACNRGIDQVDIILGNNNKDAQAIEDMCAGLSGFVLHHVVNNMAQLMLDADLAIGAGGSSQWERCCMGLPSLVVSLAENQTTIAENLAENGIITYLGTAEGLSQDSLQEAIEDLLATPIRVAQLSSRSAALVDGMGGERVIKTLIDIAGIECEIRLREVENTDIDWIYYWQNQPGIRIYSRNKNAPTWDEHERWFSTIATQCVWFRIICIKDYPVGMIRLSRKKHGNAHEISILINQEFHGLGIATHALAGCLRDNSQYSIYAFIEAENIASIRLFESNGFCKADDGYYWPS